MTTIYDVWRQLNHCRARIGESDSAIVKQLFDVVETHDLMQPFLDEIKPIMDSTSANDWESIGEQYPCLGVFHERWMAYLHWTTLPKDHIEFKAFKIDIVHQNTDWIEVTFDDGDYITTSLEMDELDDMIAFWQRVKVQGADDRN